MFLPRILTTINLHYQTGTPEDIKLRYPSLVFISVEKFVHSQRMLFLPAIWHSKDREMQSEIFLSLELYQ